jgi:3-dehydrosphinganine reductase
MNYAQKHALITGGSSGIGKATAILLAKQSANISIIARTQATLDAAKAEIEAACISKDQKVLAISADVGVRDQAESAVKEAVAALGVPEMVFTYAGLTHPSYFADIPVEIFEKLNSANYMGTVYILKAVIPGMQQRRSGNLVLMSSGAGLVGIYGYSAYSPTKFAVRGLGEVLRAEMKPYNIKVTVVYPPDTDTPQLVEENKIKPAETRAISGTVKPLSAEAVAQSALTGMERGNFMVTQGLELNLIARLHSLAAPALQWYFDSAAAGAAKATK